MYFKNTNGFSAPIQFIPDDVEMRRNPNPVTVAIASQTCSPCQQCPIDAKRFMAYQILLQFLQEVSFQKLSSLLESSVRNGLYSKTDIKQILSYALQMSQSTVMIHDRFSMFVKMVTNSFNNTKNLSEAYTLPEVTVQPLNGKGY